MYWKGLAKAARARRNGILRLAVKPHRVALYDKTLCVRGTARGAAQQRLKLALSLEIYSVIQGESKI